MRVPRRDLDQLIADAEAASRVHEPTALDESDEKEGWRDAQQFWGGRIALPYCARGYVAADKHAVGEVPLERSQGTRATISRTLNFAIVRCLP